LATERNKPTLHPISGIGHKTLFAGGDHDAGASRDNAIPTVTLLTDLPNDATDSFYKGDVYVAVKSSIMQPSTVVRAHTELGALLQREISSTKTIGVLLTDGGPEHNITFTSVQIALVLLWRKMDFDQLVVGRSCPQNSWTNEIERVMSVLNLALYSMCFTRPVMTPYEARASVNSTESDINDENSSKWLEQHWRSSKNNAHLRERLEQNKFFHHAASTSVGVACREMTGRFLNQVWDERNIQEGYIAASEELYDFVKILTTFDPSLDEFIECSYNKSDVFTSSRCKEQFARPNSMNTFLKTHCSSSAYMFEVKAVCWQNLAKDEIAAGKNPDNYESIIHPTCPFGCRRPKQLLSIFVNSKFMPRPNKSASDTSVEAPFLSYGDAKALIDKGEPNAMDKYVPSLTIIEPKVKWIVSPVNTKGAEIQSATLCVVHNILTTVRCKNCGKPRAVYVVGGGAKWKEADRDLLYAFLEDQSLTYTCGSDFSELAATIDFQDDVLDKRKIDKKSYRPFIPTVNK
jgi:hypothetical protein